MGRRHTRVPFVLLHQQIEIVQEPNSACRALPILPAPTLPGETLATMRSKPARCTPPAAEWPRSSSMTSISDQPSAGRRARVAYCSALLSRLCST